MNDQLYLKIGKRIKKIRLENRITLSEIAVQAGVSKGLLSKIENGLTIPSLPVLFQIVKALKTDMSKFFNGISDELACGYIHKKFADYKLMHDYNSVGVEYFSMFNTSISNTAFQALLLKLAVGSKRESALTGGLIFIYLVEGKINCILSDEVIMLDPGDSLFFDGKIQHVYENLSGSMSLLLVVSFLEIL